MSIIYILIPIAILFTALGIYFFFWAVKSEQFDDLEKQGMSILFDDEQVKTSENDVEAKKDTELECELETSSRNTSPNSDVLK